MKKANSFILYSSFFKLFAVFILVAGFLFGFVSVKSVFASVEYTSFHVPLSSSCTTVETSGWTQWADLDEMVGANDGISGYTITASGRMDVSLKCYFNDFAIPENLPSNLVIDQIRFTTRGFTSFPNLQENFRYGAYAPDYIDTELTTTQWSYSYFDILTTGNTGNIDGKWDLITADLLSDGNDSYFTFYNDGSTYNIYSLDIDSIYMTVMYHYDTSALESRIISTYWTSEMDITQNPDRLSVGGDFYGSYYANSADPYTKLRATLYNHFTNEYFFLEQEITIFDTEVGFNYSNICTGVCVNGDTYSLDVQLVNDDNSRRTLASSPYYFAYNSYNPPPFSTSTPPYSTTTPPWGDDPTATSTIDDLDELLGLSPTVNAVRVYCNFLHITTFDPVACVYFFFIPAQDDIAVFVSVFRNTVLATIPFIGSFWTSTAKALPVISATIPNGVVGAGASITLDVAHSIDYILNATTSSFTNASASSTKTFYEITSPYWNAFIYILLGLYFISRIISMRLFGDLDLNYADDIIEKEGQKNMMRSLRPKRKIKKIEFDD